MSEKKKTMRAVIEIIIAVLVISAVYFIIRGMDRHDVRIRQAATENETQRVWKEFQEKTVSIKLHKKTWKFAHPVQTYLFIGTDKSGNEDAEGEEYHGSMADALMLVVVDKEEKTYGILQLNRDTITEVPMLLQDGSANASAQMQLCTAHWYGKDKAASCDNTVETVSKMLGGLPIDGYYALKMDAMPLLNHEVGGVTVTLEDDMTKLDPAMKKGATLTLTDRLALPLFVPVTHFAVLHERDRIIVLSAVFESRAPDRPVTDFNRIHVFLVIDHRKVIAFLNPEKVDRPGVNIRQIHRQHRTHPIVDHAIPQRRRNGGRLHPPFDGHVLRIHIDPHRIPAQVEHQVIGHRSLVHEIGQPGRRVFRLEGGIFLPCLDPAQAEHGLRLPGNLIDQAGTHAVTTENLPDRFAEFHGILGKVVFPDVDSVKQDGRIFLRHINEGVGFGRRSAAVQRQNNEYGEHQHPARGNRNDFPIFFHSAKLLSFPRTRNVRKEVFMVILRTGAAARHSVRRLFSECVDRLPNPRQPFEKTFQSIQRQHIRPVAFRNGRVRMRFDKKTVDAGRDRCARNGFDHFGLPAGHAARLVGLLQRMGNVHNHGITEVLHRRDAAHIDDQVVITDVCSSDLRSASRSDCPHRGLSRRRRTSLPEREIVPF